MNRQAKQDSFDDIESIVADPLKFKEKLAIGEDAYTSLKVKNSLYSLWDVAGTAGTAATFAKSSIVASTFFAPTGFLAAFGIGTAVTPIGWVIAASVVTGGAWMGITHYLKRAQNDRVTVIPKFLNTPIDLLALTLFDLIAPLALKVAAIDGEIDPKEKEHIMAYFVRGWGYDKVFIDKGIKLVESKLPKFSIKETAQALAEFKKKNPDCNYKSMSQEILQFLQNIIEADGRIDEREEMAIEKVKSIFTEAGKINLKNKADTCLKSIGNSACKNSYIISLKRNIKTVRNRNPNKA